MNSFENDFLVSVLSDLIAIPSPSGYTDQVVRYVCKRLDEMKVSYELTRRGAIRAVLKGKDESPTRSIVAHLDTLGAMVKRLNENGRLSIAPIGHWSSRFAEGARVTIFTDSGPKRGSILPLKASGHTYNTEIDSQPVSWENVEVRIDEKSNNRDELRSHGFEIGDFVSIDPNFEVTHSGFINSRHLDNKAGVASLLSVVKEVQDKKLQLPVDCHILFTIMEEVGSGASAVLRGDVAEMVSIDNSTVAPLQNSSEFGVTIAMKDSTGPFDYHLTKHLLGICSELKLNHSRDVFRYYRCDAASAIEAGNDIRTALVCFSCDGSHGYERTHIHSLKELKRLLLGYLESNPVNRSDAKEMGSLSGFPSQPIVLDPQVSGSEPRKETYED
ncbi:MAG: osmoprotectant NAGGN system M42 family peptidase [Bdellovibrionales bacterium]|nr:osmoprotectant NAGGN system M42 family peptidase [Bdellovibrionales bacterium]